MNKRKWVNRVICIVLIICLSLLTYHMHFSNHLSLSHASEITPTISIINSQSYPIVGGYWRVSFTVKGTADLTIRPVHGTTWDRNYTSQNDLQFIHIIKDEEQIPINWDNNSICIRNFSASSTISETSRVLSLGKHVLQFTFGGTTVYAYNDASNWWDSNWGYRKLIIFNESQVSGSLSEFPSLISCVDNDLDIKAESDGHDIVFVSYQDNTTIYPHEIESYLNGSLNAWVRVSQMTSSKSVKLWMYYGNSVCSNQENKTGVWDDNYVGVWHLNNNFNDSTSNYNNGTIIGSPTTIPGKIANSFIFDGNGDAVNISHNLSLRIDDYTIECWIDAGSTQNNWAGIIGKHYQTNNEYMLQFDSQGDDVVILHGGDLWDSNIDLNEIDDEWTYLLLSRVGNTETSYYNGIQRRQATFNTDPDQTNEGNMTFGQERAGIRFNGSLDEIRISSIARNASWIQTTYNTIHNASHFITFGSEESAAPFVSDPIPLDENQYVANTPNFFEISVFDPNPDLLNITWRTNQSGIWETFNVTNGTGNGVPDGSYQAINTSWVTLYDQPYWWSVNVTDGTHWTNETYQFTMHQFTPIINEIILVNTTGNKLDNSTGSLTCLNQYYLSLNITDTNGWEDIDYVNVTSWFDQGDDTTVYNETLGGNLNIFLQYENTSGIGIFRLNWPHDEILFSSNNCSETMINDTTRVINFSFTPNKQIRYAISNNTWIINSNMFDDPYSWNMNCTVDDAYGNQDSIKAEYGVCWYGEITATENIEITGAPGMSVSSTIMTVTYSSNSAYHLYVYMEKNFTQTSGSDIINIANNLSLLENADPFDELIVNTTFTGIGENNYITLFNTSAPRNDTESTVDVQFRLSIPFGTWGSYSSIVAKKIVRET